MTLRLGVIGLSPGNGHPYSWSAIFNGYDPCAMRQCGFPAISEYLDKQKFPEDRILAAKVTHIWTQDQILSKKIAQASLIPSVVNCYTDLIGKVDGILLARDDSESHLKLAPFFLRAGLPIYIDKPLALTISDAKELLSLQQFPGQIFSCSALRYASELKLNIAQRNKIGDVRSIHAYAPKDWDKYSIHVIEPLLQIIPFRGEIERWVTSKNYDRSSLIVNFSSGIDIQIHTFGSSAAPLSIRVFGEHNWCDLFFTNTFQAFRSTLNDFVFGILNSDIRISSEEMLDVVRIVELGRGHES